MVADHYSSDRDNDGWDSLRVFNAAFENNLGIHFNVEGERPNSWTGQSSNISRDEGNAIYKGSFGTVESIGFWRGTCITIIPSLNSTSLWACLGTGFRKRYRQYHVLLRLLCKWKICRVGRFLSL